jgi:ribonuclease P protein component
MPKKYRLSGEELKKISGKRNHGKLFSLLVAPLSGDYPKFAIVVSKKIAKKAVDRNKIKRRTRNALLKCFRSVSKPSALVLYAKPDAKNAEFSELLRDVEALFSNL